MVVHLFQIILEELFNVVEWYDIQVVVEVSVVCAGNYHQTLVVAFEPYENLFAEITRVSLFSVNQHYGSLNLSEECVEGVLMNASGVVLVQPVEQAGARSI